MNEELKPLPCPFCGGEEFEVSSDEDSVIYIRCMGRGCGCFVTCGDAWGDGGEQDGNGMTAADRAQAYSVWNDRIASPASEDTARLDWMERTGHTPMCNDGSELEPNEDERRWVGCCFAPGDVNGVTLRECLDKMIALPTTPKEPA